MADPQSGPDLGALMPRDPNQGDNTWANWIAQNRPFLANMGAQLMAGSSGGNFLSELGHGIATGNAGQALTEQEMHNRAEEDKKRAETLSENEKNRTSHEKIAKMGADSRNEVAQIRSEAMLQRAALIHGPQNNQEMKIYSDAANKHMHDEIANRIVTGKSLEQIKLEADAIGKERLRGAREASGVRSQGAALPSGADSGSTEGVGSRPAPTPTPGQTPATGQGGQKPTWDQIKSNPKIQELLKNSTGIAQLRASLKAENRADLIPYLDREEALLNAPQSPGM